jgi:uncharacterized membrane protein YgcG
VAAPVPVGDGLSERQRHRIETAIGKAERTSGLNYDVWIGAADEDLRTLAERVHAEAGDRAPRTVLIAVDPARRGLEIVTGSVARNQLDDRSCALSAMTMTSCFSGGDLVGGITQGLASLAAHASGA